MREGLVEWCETERKTDRVAKSDLCRLPSSGRVRQQVHHAGLCGWSGI